MKDGPNISRVASLIGDPARCNMLLSLMDGRALTASELAATANIAKQTASSHLGKLLAGGLLSREIQGRHHYYRLSDNDVAEAIEALLNVAARGPGIRLRTGPKDPALRKARICYDHLAGEMGVIMYERMSNQGWLVEKDQTLRVSQAGWRGLEKIDIRPKDLVKSRRPECKTCLDWSMRRHHLAGKAGALILSQLTTLGWARRLPESRVMAFSNHGEASFMSWLS